MTMEFKGKALVSVIYVLSFLSYGGAAATAVTSTTDYSAAPGAATNTDHHSEGGVASGWDLASNLQLRARTTFCMCNTTCGSVSAGAATNTTDYSVGGGGGGRSGSDFSSNLRLRAWGSDSTLAAVLTNTADYSATAGAATNTERHSAATAAATNTDHHSDDGVASGWDLASNLQLRARTTFCMCDTTCGSVSAGAATNTTDYSVGGGGDRSGSDFSSNLLLRAWGSDSTLALRRVPQPLPPVPSETPFSLVPGGLKQAIVAIIVALLFFEILSFGEAVLVLFVILRVASAFRGLERYFS